MDSGSASANSGWGADQQQQQRQQSRPTNMPETPAATPTLGGLPHTIPSPQFVAPPLVICKSDSKPELSDLSADLVPEHCVLNAPILEL
jgi:hypothetical protein